MSDETADAKEFVFSDDQLDDWLKELETWAKKHNLTPSELCVVLGFLHEWLKHDLGIEVVQQDVVGEEKPKKPRKGIH